MTTAELLEKFVSAKNNLCAARLELETIIEAPEIQEFPIVEHHAIMLAAEIRALELRAFAARDVLEQSGT